MKTKRLPQVTRNTRPAQLKLAELRLAVARDNLPHRASKIFGLATDFTAAFTTKH